MSGATPGPWAISELHANGLFGNNGEAFVSSADYRVAAIDCHTKYKRGDGYKAKCDERDANARLIAAAPDLLAALQRLLTAVEYTNVLPGEKGEAIRAVAFAAIANATGAAT